MNYKFSATEAKNRFGTICALAKQGPVLVAKDGRPDTVILSISHYEQLLKSSMRKEESKDEASRRFAEKHKEFVLFWTEETEAQGTWSDGLRTW